MKLSTVLNCILIITIFFACNKSPEKSQAYYDDFNNYITGYNSSPISRCGKVYVNLNFSIPENIEVNYNLFDIHPNIGGKIRISNDRKMISIINPELKHNITHKVKFNIGKLTTMPEGMDWFEFDLEAIRQSWNITMEAPVSTSMEDVSYTGKVNYTDCEPNKSIFHEAMTAFQDGTRLQINWDHKDNNNSRTSDFTILGIKRKDNPDLVKLKLSMSPINVNDESELQLPIPSRSDFSLHNIHIHSNKHIRITFTDPLQEDQNITGLINVIDREILKTNIKHNYIDVYFKEEQFGRFNVTLIPGIKNLAGFDQKDEYTRELFFAPPSPSVKITEKGHILPPSGSWELPVSLISATGFRMRVLKIGKQNAHRFYQENRKELAEQRGLENIGRIVLDTIYNLDVSNPYKLNYVSIDLSKQIKKESGALYKIFLSIPAAQNAYPCDDPIIIEQNDFLSSINFDNPGINYYNEYDYYEDYYYSSQILGNRYYNDEYYTTHTDACTPNFSAHIHDQRLLICSDIGVIFKSEPEDDGYFAYVSHISSAFPISNAKVDLLNFQGEKISTSYTNGNGMVSIATKEKPFLIAVSYNDQYTYLPVSDAKAISLSTFQVEGKDWKGKSKIFFYAERDVWRPGDSIYMHAIIHDKLKNIPKDLPLNISLFDPTNKLVKKWTASSNSKGLYDCRFKTELNAPTGYWSIKINYAGETHYKDVRIETIRPNRLKMIMDFADDILIKKSQPKTAPLSVQWMHGLQAENLKAEISMMQKMIDNPFGANYSNYSFNDLSKKYQEDKGLVKTGTTDSSGVLDFTIPTDKDKNYPGVMLFNFNLRAFEHGGAFSSDMKAIRYSPYTSYVGVKFPGGDSSREIFLQSDEAIQLVNLDQNGNSISGKVDIKLSKINSEWWYQFGSKRRYAALSNNITDVKKSFTKVIPNGGSTISIEETGRFLLTVTDIISGHSVSRIIYVYRDNFWSNDTEEVSQLEVLPFKLEKEEYNVDDIIQFDLPAVGSGHYLITIESGGKITYADERPVTNFPTTMSISVTESMAPSSYIHVHLIQAWDKHLNDRPLRLFGIKPIKVFNPSSILNPVINMSEELKTNEKFVVNISEQSNKPMSYTLAIVDEGLLDISQFKTPDPWSSFFGKERLSVKTWDMYKDIFHRFLGEFTTLLAVGGDGSNTIAPTAKARRFKPAIKFIGPIELAAGETNSHELVIDEYVGSVRAMVVATNGTSFGRNQKTVPVKKPLMLYTTLPRVLGPSEKLKVPVTVFAMNEDIKNVNLSIELDDNILPIGDVSQQLVFDKVGEENAYFEIAVKDVVGVSTIKVIAQSGDYFAEEAIEIDIRPSSPIINTTIEDIVLAGESKNIKFQPLGMLGTQKGSVSISKSLNFSFAPHVKWLSRYPHGCLEQTVSSVFPQIYLYKMNLLDDVEQMSYRQKFDAAIQKLRFMQLPKGGFSYWSGGNVPNSWGTSYALEFLYEAKQMGYKVPQDIIDKSIQYQYKTAENWTISSNTGRRISTANIAIDQAYRLYTLALTGKPHYAAMNRLRLAPQISPTAKWILAHAMIVIGEHNTADQILKTTSDEIENYRELAGSFGSKVRDQAMIARILIDKGKTLEAKRVIDELVPYFSAKKRRYLSTQDVSQCLITFAKFLKDLESVEDSISYTIKLNQSAVAIKNMLTEQPTTYPFDDKSLDESMIALKNNGNAPMFVSIDLSGLPKRDDSPAEAQDLELSVNYFNDANEKIDPTEIKKGTDFIIEYKIKHTGSRLKYENLALSTIYPSGWEIINKRMNPNSNFDEGDQVDYRDIRDDRIYMYFSLDQGKSKIFRVRMNATYEGEYWAPPVSCEAMYDASIRAKSKGFTAKVI